MQQRFRTYLSLALWLLGAVGIFLLTQTPPPDAPPSKAKAIALFLLLLPLLDLWRRFRRVTLLATTNGIELRRGSLAVANYDWNQVETWTSGQSLRLLIRLLAMATVLLAFALFNGSSQGWARLGTIGSAVASLLLIAAALYDHRNLWTFELTGPGFPASRSITIHRGDADALFGQGPWSGKEKSSEKAKS